MSVIEPTNSRTKNPTLVLGTAQLGMCYGIANTSGLPSERSAADLLSGAVAAGIRYIDTARAYGKAEQRIGAFLKTSAADVHVVTKLDPLTEVASVDDALTAARASLAASRRALGRDRLDTVLLHRAIHRTDWNGAVWNFLRGERDANRIGRLGVSAQNPAETVSALGDRDIAHIQFPYNVLDRRWDDAGIIAMVAERPDVVVHVRSVLLQGLLVAGPETRWPSIMSADSVRRLLADMQDLTGELRLRGRADLCIAFVRSQHWIDGVVIGMETKAQLQANLDLFSHRMLSQDELAVIRARIPQCPDLLLDPAQWNIETGTARPRTTHA